MPEYGPVPAAWNFAFGMVANVSATCVVQPLDLVKTRMQVLAAAGAPVASAAVSPATVVTDIVRKHGVGGLYEGMSAALMRQLTYGTARFGLYATLSDYAAQGASGPLPVATKFACGATAGGLASLIGTPAEVALVRMTADGLRPAAERRNYKHAADALARIVAEEGVGKLWSGVGPTVARAIVINGAQLGSYSQAKETIAERAGLDGIPLHAAASMVAGLVATAASLPVDLTKTKLQNQKMVNGVPEFSGPGAIVADTLKREGPLGLWRGFAPYYFKLAPHTIISFIVLEQCKRLLFESGGGSR